MSFRSATLKMWNASSMFSKRTTKTWDCQYSSSSVLNSSGLENYSKDWEDEERRSKLTSSTFNSALGFFRWRRVQLWMDKVGLMKFSLADLPAIRWKRAQTTPALACYQTLTGNEVTLKGLRVHRKHEWLAGTPDSIIDYGPCGQMKEAGMVIIKCPYFQGNAKDSVPSSVIPACYMPQAQCLMEIMDRSWIDFYIWTPKGSSLFRMQRDAHYWELILPALSDFWWKHVEPAKRLRAIDEGKDVSKLQQASMHEPIQVISRESVALARDSRLLVKEFFEVQDKIIKPLS